MNHTRYKLIIVLMLLVTLTGGIGLSNNMPKESDSDQVIQYRHLFSSGGGIRQVGPFTLNMSIGQSAVGSSKLGDFSLDTGMWPSPEQSFLCGDVDFSGNVDIDDIMYIINYMFAGGPTPDPIIGNVNCLEAIDIDDIMFIINYMFSGGPVPCAECLK